MPNRREVMTWLAGLLPTWLASRLGLARNNFIGKSYVIEEVTLEVTKGQVIWPQEETRYVVVSGATLPGADTIPSYRPTVSQVRAPGIATFAKLDRYADDAPAHCKPTDILERVYPNVPRFSVTPEVVVGTIDELVEDYREKLTRAAERLDEIKFIYTDETRAAQQAWLDKHYPRTGKAVTVPWDQQAAVNYCAELQEFEGRKWYVLYETSQMCGNMEDRIIAIATSEKRPPSDAKQLLQREYASLEKSEYRTRLVSEITAEDWDRLAEQGVCAHDLDLLEDEIEWPIDEML